MTKRRRRRPRRPDREPKVRASWVRVDVQVRRGRRLRVLVYARFSSDEQRRRSIKAQVELCKKFLKALGVTFVEITVISDEAKSGELRSRPGVDEVWSGIRERAWDLMLVEDSSRLYRDEVACLELVRLAVDNDVRTICINDYVDSAQEEWEGRLKEAACHHASSNRYSSRRIKRAHEELWEMGAALGLLRPGYRRVPSVPATENDPAEGPFFDEIDPVWAPSVEQIYLRIAAKDPPWLVADWATETGLPKTSNSQKKEWTDKNIISLVRSTVYRAFETYRDEVSRKEFSTGKRKPKPNDPDEVLTRDMPHLRIVSDALWHSANQVVDGRNCKGKQPSGKDNPQYGIPRNSRGPLSEVFVCINPEHKMIVDRRVEGGYSCAQAKDGGCWNKATAVRDKTHRWISDAICNVLQSLGSAPSELATRTQELFDDDGRREAQLTKHRRKQNELETLRRRLARGIELAKQPPEILVDKLETCEARLDVVNSKIESLQLKQQVCAPPTPSEIRDRVTETMATVRKMDRTSRDEIKRLVGTISAVPHQQFGSNLIVLRARFEVRLSAILPIQTQVTLAGLCDQPLPNLFPKIPVSVDLFEPSAGPRYGLRAIELMKKYGRRPTRISEELGITKRRACIALDYGEALIAAGLTDPYIELTEPPANASRWRLDRYHKKHGNA